MNFRVGRSPFSCPAGRWVPQGWRWRACDVRRSRGMSQGRQRQVAVRRLIATPAFVVARSARPPGNSFKVNGEDCSSPSAETSPPAGDFGFRHCRQEFYQIFGFARKGVFSANFNHGLMKGPMETLHSKKRAHYGHSPHEASKRSGAYVVGIVS